VALSVAGLPFGASAIFSPATLTAAGTSTMTLSTTGGTAAGTYSLAVTGSSGVINRTASVTLAVMMPGSGGMMAGSVATPLGAQNLTVQGTLDWVHWGYSHVTSPNRKSNVSQQIGPLTLVGGASAFRYTDNPIGFTWSDGTPNKYATNTPTGVFTSGQNRGFSITVPADTIQRTLKLFVTVRAIQGRLVAHLNDNSVPDYVDVSLNSVVATVGVYTITYKAASSGQTMTVMFTQANTTNGVIAVQAAALSP
jgi:hypothetical protein